MPLIKHAAARDLARDAVVLDFADLHRQAETILDSARAQAARIVETGEAERRRLIADASEVGRREGLARGLAEGRELGRSQGQAQALADSASAIEQLSKGFEQALDQFIAARDDLLHRARTDVVTLACEIARKVVHRSIATDPAVVADQLSGVLAMVIRSSRLTIAIHPDDRTIASAALPGLMSRFASVVHAELVDDPALSRGSVVARVFADSGNPDSRGAGGELDASIDTQLDRIVEVLVPGARRLTRPTPPPTEPPAAAIAPAPPDPANASPTPSEIPPPSSVTAAAPPAPEGGATP